MLLLLGLALRAFLLLLGLALLLPRLLCALLLLLRFTRLALLLQLLLLLSLALRAFLLLLRLALLLPRLLRALLLLLGFARLALLLQLLLLLGLALRAFLLLLRFAILLLLLRILLRGLAACRRIDRGGDRVERVRLRRYLLRTALQLLLLHRRLVGGSGARHRCGSARAGEVRARDLLVTLHRHGLRTSLQLLLRGLRLLHGGCRHGCQVAVGPAANHLVALRQHLLHLRGRHDLLLAQRIGSDLHKRVLHRTAIDENVTLHHGRAAIAVVAAPVVAPAVPLARAVVTYHDVDAVGICPVGAIPRLVTVPRREGIPADDGRGASGAHVHVPVGAAHPSDQGRGPCRAIVAAARTPGPTIAHVDPTAIVERRIAPRRFVDPGPAPGTHIAPVAGAVGRPIGGDTRREPQRAVIGLLDPAAVAIEVLVTRHIGGHITARPAIGPVTVARVGPAVEAVDAGALRHIGRRRTAEDAYRAAGRDADAPALRFHARVARKYREARLFALRVHVDAVAPIGQDREARVGGGKRDAMVRLLVAHANVRAAALDARVDLVLVETRDVELRILVEADRGGAYAQLGARTARGPDRVFRGDRRVDERLVPAELGVLVDRDRALGVGEPADSAGRLLGVREACERRGERQQKESDITHGGTFPIGVSRYGSGHNPSTRKGPIATTAARRVDYSDHRIRAGFANVSQFIFQGAEFMPLLPQPKRDYVAGAVTAGSRGV